MLTRLIALVALPLMLIGCGAEPKWASDAEVAKAVYRHDGAPTLTLITAISNTTQRGGHSGLMVSGSQRVMFDPAGTWFHNTVPERNDVMFGMTPLMLDFYTDYHARPSYHVVFQEITVTPEMAERALAAVQAHGAAPKATCANSISGILMELGFDAIDRTYFPERLMADFADLPGVRTRKVFDNTPDDNDGALDTHTEALFALGG